MARRIAPMGLVMGYGDELMGIGLASLAPKHKKVAFGDGRRIYWSAHAREVFHGHDEIVPPGHEIRRREFHWIKHFTGQRLYHKGHDGKRWIYNENFKATPANLFFKPKEELFAWHIPQGYVLIEPNVKQIASNKQWLRSRYQQVADALSQLGFTVAQFLYGAGQFKLEGVNHVITPSFMSAASALRKAALYIGPEGGMHHAAAAVGTPAVVIFGGFIHPKTTGYEGHSNLFVGERACGMRHPCHHCIDAMSAISVEQVIHEARNRLALSRWGNSLTAMDATGEPSQGRNTSVSVQEIRNVLGVGETTAFGG